MNSHVRLLVVGRSVIIPMLASEHLFAQVIRYVIALLIYNLIRKTPHRKKNKTYFYRLYFSFFMYVKILCYCSIVATFN